MALSRREFLFTSAGAGLALSALGAAEAPKIRVGQIGTGHAHASGKMEALRHSADFEMVGIAEPDPQRRAQAQQNKAYAEVPWLSVDELLATPGLQLVAVESEVKNLVPLAARCVAAGKHLHLDKPAGESLAEFKALLDEATRQKRTLQMGYMFRYNPAFERAFELFREGALGEIFSIDAVMSKAIGAGEHQSLRAYRGGSMFELGCHLIDSVVRFLGRPDKVTPYLRSGSADGFSDNQLAVLEYAKATVTIRSSLLEIEGGARRQFVICGTKGTFEIHPLEPPKAKLALDEARGGFQKGYQDLEFTERVGRYASGFSDLAKIIRGEKSHAFSPEHDYAVQETVLRASGLM